jgi:hypothetical protein
VTFRYVAVSLDPVEALPHADRLPRVSIETAANRSTSQNRIIRTPVHALAAVNDRQGIDAKRDQVFQRFLR